MSDPTEVQAPPSLPVASGEKISVSLVFRDVPKDKRQQLEALAKEFAKKHRKLVNYIEK